MSNQPAAANRHHLAAPFFPGSQPWEAPDPLPVMRRELKLLLIEMNVLRVEVEQLRAIEHSFRVPSAGSSTAETIGAEKRNASARSLRRYRHGHYSGGGVLTR
ncbi:MAG: hypothetical protein E6G76_10105 [Alphaproteobacteria bacterium]|nr:MAG: hypothetical protein E6G76_10105 [Alphaproteobacteria bacterium]